MNNPMQEPLTIFKALTAPVGTLGDKLRLVELMREVNTVTRAQDFFLDEGTSTLDYLQPVSYTHLDVYKRQWQCHARHRRN